MKTKVDLTISFSCREDELLFRKSDLISQEIVLSRFDAKERKQIVESLSKELSVSVENIMNNIAALYPKQLSLPGIE